MKLKKLKKQLEQYPDNLLVMVNGYEGGYDDIVKIKKTTMCLNVHCDNYYGDHEIKKDTDDSKNYKQVEAIIFEK